MSNAFEKRIRDNKDEFDSETPPDKVWDSIEQNIPGKKARVFTLKDILKWSAAAAIVCIVLTSAYFLFWRKADTIGPVVKTTHEEKNLPGNTNDISTLAPEYATEAQQIFKEIGTRQAELQNSTKDKPLLYQQFADDLKVLDSSYHELTRQAAISSNRDLIIEAIMNNLKLQAELLARQLTIISIPTSTNPSHNAKDSNQSL
jgi:hypothetical protein